MNKLEFKKAMKYFNVDHRYSTNNFEDIYCWHDIDIHLNKNNKISISGKIPKEINFYTSIETLEDLVKFLKEVANYYKRENKEPEITEDINDIISSIKQSVLYELKPNISNENWLKQYDKEYKLYKKTRERNRDTIHKMFLESLQDFDNAVNPFLLNNPEIYDIKNYIDNVAILTFNIKEFKTDMSDNCNLAIIDKAKGNRTEYYRFPGTFSYKVIYKLAEDDYYEVEHTLLGKDNSYTMDEKGEILSIHKFGIKCPNPTHIRANLTKNTIGEYLKEKHKMTFQEKSDLYLDLLTGLNMAKSVTEENMIYKNKGKRLIKNDGNIFKR